ncbi:hypothetical protein TUMEXPCC7403_21725 [Tumidithrix helvetica PCC 7403]|uniref:PAS domain S-box protein n=1 Tax=Tumidithrix helvetica TaxID=3457545 RepID=UPI003C8D1777
MTATESIRETILIVDDNPDNLKVLSQMLADLEYEVSIATDGEMAIEQAQYARPDLILLDILMVGIDGFETCRRMKANPQIQEIPIIFMTALSDMADKVQGFSLGAVDFISKPFQAQELLARVKVHLDLRNLTKRLESKNIQLEQVNQKLQGELSDRKKTEEALRQSEAKNQALLSALPDLVMRVSQDGIYLDFISTETFKVIGKTGDFIGTRVDRSLPPDLAQRRMQAIAKAIQTRMLQIYEQEIVVDDLAQTEEVRVTPCGDREVLVVVRDISDRKQAEKALLDSEQRFRSVFEQAAVGIVRASLSGQFLQVNQRFCEIVGYTEAEILEKTFKEITYEEDLERDLTYVRQLLNGDISTFSMEKRYICKDGQLRWIDLTGSLIRDASGLPQYFVAIVEDIQVRKLAEIALEQELKRSKLLLEASFDGIVVIDEHGNVIESNPSFAKMLGYAPEEVTKLNVVDWDAKWTPEELQRGSQEFKLKKKSVKFETRHRRKDGSICDVEVSANSIDLLDETLQISICRDITDRKRNEQALKESEELAKLRERQVLSLLNNVPHMAWLKDREGRFLAVNEPFAQTCGYTPSQLVGLTDLDIWPLELAKAYLRDDREVMKSGKQKRVEEGLITTDGTELWIETIKTPIVGDSNKSIGTAGISMNITERRRVEIALRESERRYATLTEAAPVGIFRFDAAGECVYVNDRWCEMTGRSAEAGMRMGWVDTLHPEDRGRLMMEWSQAMQQGGFYKGEARYLRPDGTQIWFYAQVIPETASNGELLGYVGTVTDISDRKQSEESIRQKNQELELALKQLQNTQTELVQSEKMAILGQLVAGVAHEINTPLGVIQSSIKNVRMALDSSLHNLPQVMQQLSDERWADFLSLLTTVNETQHSLSFREERQLRRQLTVDLTNHAIANAEILGDYLSRMSVSQDLTPLLPLLQESNNSFVIETAYNLSSIQSNTKNITFAAEQAAKIVFALKSYSRYNNSGRMTLTSITDGIDIVLTIYQHLIKQGVEVIKRYDDIPHILCYPEELNQVWTNLIHNAIQAMNHRGELEIRVAERERHIVVEIIDSGCGISSDIKERIFEPFFTTKPIGEGSGLGLDIVRKIVEKHSGKIEVKSRVGKTTFTVWLPIRNT